jgi:hypothetical protein
MKNDLIKISLSELKKIKLTPNELKLTIYLIDYFVKRENQDPKGLIKLRTKCEELLGFKVITT